MANVLVLLTCDGNMVSSNGVRWPKSGYVSAPDWDPEPVCGGGLHGLLRGEGDHDLLDMRHDANWLVCSVDPVRIVNLNGKVKFPECEVVHVGDIKSAANYIHSSLGYPRNYNPAVGGRADSGGSGRSVAGAFGYAKVGDFGEAIVGDYGQADAADWGRAVAGVGGSVKAGYEGVISLSYWDYTPDRIRIAVGYIGEQGLEPGVWYGCVEGKFVKVAP